MKTIIAAFFANCVVSLAQPTNVNPSTGRPQWPADGKITDTNFQMPVSFTNSIGDFIPDAIPARLFANKLIYTTAEGGGGTIRLEKLPPDLQKKFGYNPSDAAAADIADKQKKEQREQFRRQQTELAAQEANWDAELKNAIAPFVYSKRMINNRMVNLSPLFLWWKSDSQKRTLERPLSEWVHITGTNMGTMNYCWIVNAEIEDSPGHVAQTKIALENPPVDESEKFATAGAELNDLDAQIKNVADWVGYAFDDENEAARTVNTALALGVSPYSDKYRSLENQRMQIANRKASLIQKEDNLKLRREELQQFLKRFPPGSVYRLDFFAMNTGKVFYGLPLYDIGVRYP